MLMVKIEVDLLNIVYTRYIVSEKRLWEPVLWGYDRKDFASNYLEWAHLIRCRKATCIQ